MKELPVKTIYSLTQMSLNHAALGNEIYQVHFASIVYVQALFIWNLARPLQAKMSQVQLSRHVNRSIVEEPGGLGEDTSANV